MPLTLFYNEVLYQPLTHNHNRISGLFPPGISQEESFENDLKELRGVEGFLENGQGTADEIRSNAFMMNCGDAARADHECEAGSYPEALL